MGACWQQAMPGRAKLVMAENDYAALTLKYFLINTCRETHQEKQSWKSTSLEVSAERVGSCVPIQSTVSKRLIGACCMPGPTGVPGSQNRPGAAGTPLSPQPSERKSDFLPTPGWTLFPAVLKRSTAPANGLFDPGGIKSHPLHQDFKVRVKPKVFYKASRKLLFSYFSVQPTIISEPAFPARGFKSHSPTA